MRDAPTIGLDLGTTACKALALGPDGRTLASARANFPPLGEGATAEQEAEEAWRIAAGTLRELAAKTDLSRAAAMGLSGAMHSLLPVARDGRPLARALTWADPRPAAALEGTRRACDPTALYRRTGCPVRALYYPVRLRWWARHDPAVFRGAARFVAIKEWVTHRLTGAWATDAGLASTTGLLDLRRAAWDEEALAVAGIDAGRLPRLVSPASVVGLVSPAAAKETGLPAGLSVVAGGSDGGLANLGAAGAAVGQTVLTVGTSGAIRLTTDRPAFDDRERTWCYLLLPPGGGDRWIVGGAINNGGLALDWVRRRLYGVEDWDAATLDLMMREAAAVAPGAEGLTVLPYFAGDRNPHWDPYARAAMHGLKLHHTRGHVVRATLEGVAMCLADVWEAVRGLDVPRSPGGRVWLTGGITRSPLWAQIVADVLGVELTAMEGGDASALGAARLARASVLGEALDLSPAVEASVVYRPTAAHGEAYAEPRRRFVRLAREMVFQKPAPEGPYRS